MDSVIVGKPDSMSRIGNNRSVTIHCSEIQSWVCAERRFISLGDPGALGNGAIMFGIGRR
jgi:hypothetical protein